jgi:hypothetical protein
MAETGWLTDEIVEIAMNEWVYQHHLSLEPGDPSYEESRGKMRKVLLKAIGERISPPEDSMGDFVLWLKRGPKLAHKLGLYVGIKVTAAPTPQGEVT